MSVTDQIKILDNKIKSSQGQYDLSREAAQISALSSKDLLGKYGYFTGEDFGDKPNVFEKLSLSILHWTCHLVKHLKKMRLKVLLKAKVILIITANILFTDFTKGMMNLKICH